LQEFISRKGDNYKGGYSSFVALVDLPFSETIQKDQFHHGI